MTKIATAIAMNVTTTQPISLRGLGGSEPPR